MAHLLSDLNLVEDRVSNTLASKNSSNQGTFDSLNNITILTKSEILV